MTQDKIIEFANKTLERWVAEDGYSYYKGNIQFLETFAALVAAHEREECATIADEWDKVNKLSNYGAFIAQQIRARSNT